MRKNAQILVIALSLLTSVQLFVVWLPQKIAEKSLLLQSQMQIQNTTPAVEVLSQDLLTHIEDERKKNSEHPDGDFEKELLARLEAFHKDTTKSSNDVLEDRFSRFTNNLGQNNFQVDVPKGLEEIVEFWIQIFGVFDKNQVVFYHNDDVGVVYSVIDFSSLPEGSEDRLRDDIIKEELARLRTVTRNVSHVLKTKNGYADLDENEKRILELLEKRQDHLDWDADALGENLSYRFGFAHRMRQSMVLSTRYMPHIQTVIKERGLPEILCAIPFVESAFNFKAYSKAGAAGLWQFIEDTGRNYLKIDQYVDERFDPVLATYAATAHLAKEYDMLGSWPLTINAYNTGPGRVMKAVQQLRTNDIATIIKKFKGSGYGFDSRNYFPEVLAAYHVYKNREHYFGATTTLAQEVSDYIAMPTTTNILELARAADLHPDLLSSLNPALKPEVLYGQIALPKGYFLKVPKNQKENVLLAAQEMYMNTQSISYHVVKRGETLKAIAQKYALSEDDLRKSNDLLPEQKLKKGDILKLPEEFVQSQFTYLKQVDGASDSEVKEEDVEDVETQDDTDGVADDIILEDSEDAASE